MKRRRRDTTESPWQTVQPAARSEGTPAGIRRLAVPGGWLYQVARDVESNGDVDWHPPVFVLGMASFDGGET